MRTEKEKWRERITDFDNFLASSLLPFGQNGFDELFIRHGRARYPTTGARSVTIALSILPFSHKEFRVRLLSTITSRSNTLAQESDTRW